MLLSILAGESLTETERRTSGLALWDTKKPPNIMMILYWGICTFQKKAELLQTGRNNSLSPSKKQSRQTHNTWTGTLAGSGTSNPIFYTRTLNQWKPRFLLIESRLCLVPKNTKTSPKSDRSSHKIPIVHTCFYL